MIGSTDSEVEETKKWLIDVGADPETVKVSPLRDSISATFKSEDAKAASLRGAFSVDMLPAGVEFVIHRGSQSSSTLRAASKLRTSGSSAGRYTVENIKKAYGIPVDLKATNESTLQMVWGPGTFGYSESQLKSFKSSQCPLLNTDKVKFDTQNHGHIGDNYMEGNLDTQMISAFGLDVETLVSNTNTTSSTEEGEGFGEALLDFVTQLQSRSVVPQVLSLSLGSLSAYSCDLLISEAQKAGFSEKEVRQYLQQQRQVCMFLSREQVRRINTGVMVLN
jgi:hypothetical protein